MGSPKFDEILNRMKAIHEKKNHDYAQENDPFSNFKRAASLAEWFNDPIDKVFAVMMGIKLARLAELHNGKSAKNESIDDSHLDLDVYAGLWHAWHLTKGEAQAVTAMPGGVYQIPYTGHVIKNYDTEKQKERVVSCRMCAKTGDMPLHVKVLHGSGYDLETITFCSAAHKESYINDMIVRGMKFHMSDNMLRY